MAILHRSKQDVHGQGRKGWSAYASAAIPEAAFVCQYAGELITRAEARSRLAAYDRQPVGRPGHALLVSFSTCEAEAAAL